jgi:hypothetical protein
MNRGMENLCFYRGNPIFLHKYKILDGVGIENSHGTKNHSKLESKHFWGGQNKLCQVRMGENEMSLSKQSRERVLVYQKLTLQ